jgi:hypothetical protein
MVENWPYQDLAFEAMPYTMICMISSLLSLVAWPYSITGGPPVVVHLRKE